MTREASKLWKKVCAEINVEIKPLLGNWKYILGGIVFQASQILRIVTFYSTQLPGPNYHCREISRLPPPGSAYEVLLLNFPRGAFYGCGDLIFLSHMIFTLVFVNTYHQYGTKRLIKQCGWLLAMTQSVLIIALRKHYTVDVVVAWYTVNLVIFFINKKLPELPDRSVSSQQILPVISQDKEAKAKDEQFNLLNRITTNGAL